MHARGPGECGKHAVWAGDGAGPQNARAQVRRQVGHGDEVAIGGTRGAMGSWGVRNWAGTAVFAVGGLTPEGRRPSREAGRCRQRNTAFTPRIKTVKVKTMVVKSRYRVWC